MAKAQEVSDSSDQEIDSDANSGSSSEDVETPRKNKISDYEKQRMKRIEENKARMEALGLKKMALSFESSIPKQTKKASGRKGKGKVDDEDEEYRPSEGEEELRSSSGEDEKNGDDDDDFDLARTRKKMKNKIRTARKPVSSQKVLSNLDFVDDDDDDEALKQAIALSLQESAGFTGENKMASQGSSTHPNARKDNATKDNSQIQEDMGKRKRKRKKSINSRVQMSEDELIIHFFQFDEAGKGNINLRDLQRIAVAHDFTWSEKEMADMILHFDSDGDGKLCLEDFRKIASRCSMIQGLEL